MIERMANRVSFNTGISTAEYNEAPVGQTLGQTQKPLLPGSTTVSEALDSVFPKNVSVLAIILSEMAVAGGNPALRTARGFRELAERTLDALKAKDSAVTRAAVEDLDRLLDDGDLLESYRASILES